MTNDLLNEIKNFAEDNWLKDEDDPTKVVGNHENVAVTNPWIDSSGRFPLANDAAAVKEWGLATVIDFCEKAKVMLACDTQV